MASIAWTLLEMLIRVKEKGAPDARKLLLEKQKLS
jgi:hypothetical protein